jgi:hypothetical protein
MQFGQNKIDKVWHPFSFPVVGNLTFEQPWIPVPSKPNKRIKIITCPSQIKLE